MDTYRDTPFGRIYAFTDYRATGVTMAVRPGVSYYVERTDRTPKQSTVVDTITHSAADPSEAKAVCLCDFVMSPD